MNSPDHIATPAHGHAPNCRNCGTPAPDTYCPACGQATHVHRASLTHFVHHFVGHYVALESQLMRSLRLLLTPGALTLEFFAGRRVRYIDPLRLYLTFSILLFFVLSLQGAHYVKSADTAAQTSASANQAASSIHGKEERQAKGFHIGITRDPAAGSAVAAKESASAVNAPPPKASAFEQWIEGFFETHSFENFSVERLEEKLGARIPYALMLMVPLLAAMLRIAYWRRPYIYGEHLVFALHAQTFAFVATLVSRIPYVDGWWSFGLFVGCMVYWCMALQRVFGGRKWLTLIRAMMIAFVYSALCAVAVGIVALFSAATIAKVSKPHAKPTAPSVAQPSSGVSSSAASTPASKPASK